MLDLYNEIVNSIDATSISGRPTKGRDACQVLLNSLTSTYHQVKVDGENQRLPTGLKNFYDQYGQIIEHHHKFTAEVLRFLHGSKMNQGDQEFYVGIFRSQVARHESILLFYYGISDKSPSDFKLLMQEMSFFCDIKKEFLLKQDHLGLYSGPAYRKPLLTVLQPGFSTDH